MAWDVWCIDWGRGHSGFRVHSYILFIDGSAGLNRPVAARRRNIMSLYYLRRRELVFRRGKRKFFGEPSQAIASQGDIARLFSNRLELSRSRRPGKRLPIAD